MSHAPSASFDPLIEPLDGTRSVAASAGTGKTYCITLLWLRLLIEESLGIESILVTTFTKAATAELGERLQARLREATAATHTLSDEAPPATQPAACVVWRAVYVLRLPLAQVRERLQTAMGRFDLAPITTIHGFCQRLIARHALDLGLDPDAEVLPDAHDMAWRWTEDELRRRLVAGAVYNNVAFLRKVVLTAAKCEANLLPTPRPFTLNAARLSDAQARVRSRLQGQPFTGRNAKGIVAALNRFCAEGLWEASPAVDRDFQAQALELVEIVKAANPAVAEAAEMAEAARHAVKREKQRVGIRTYDDLLRDIRDVLRDPGSGANLLAAVRERFQAVIVDECQDTDACQLEVFERLFRGSGAPGTAAIRTFILIGDPKQSIYRFRGADLGSYRKLVAHARVTAPMACNHRSDPGLIATLNALYAKANFSEGIFPDAGDSHAITYLPVRAKAEANRLRHKDPQKQGNLQLGWSKSENRVGAMADLARQAAVGIADAIEYAHIIDHDTQQWRRVAAGDIAVLGLKRRHLLLMRRELEIRGIPAALTGRGSGSVLASDSALDFQCWLRAMPEPGAHQRKSALTALLASPISGFDLGQLGAVVPGAYADLDADLTTCRKLLERAGPLAAMQAWLDPRLPALLTCAHGERSITHLRHLAECLQQDWLAGARTPSQLMESLGRRMADPDDEDETQAIRLESDRPAVRLMTVHASKGLEFPIVVCPFLWDLNSQSKDHGLAQAVLEGRPVLDVGSDRFKDVRQAEHVAAREEQARQTYVALTRARHQLWLGLANVRSTQTHHRNESARAWISRLLLPSLRPYTEEHLLAADTPAWEEALRETQTLADQCSGSYTRATAGEMPAPAAAAPTITPPPPCDPWHHGLLRTTSYSAIKHQEADTDLPGLDETTHDPSTTPRLDDALAGLGYGAAFGKQLHTVFEKHVGEGWPLSAALKTAGVETQAEALWEARLAPLLAQPLALPGSSPIALQDLGGQAIAEMQFLLPLKRLTPALLGAAMAVGPAPHEQETAGGIWRVWLEQLQLDFKDMRGFLQGYIDLIFEHEGRWFIADYKTNANIGDGGPAALAMEMARHDYFLQAHLYVLALHRHLQATLQGYDYATHMGGVAYLFLRAMAPDATGTRGLWHCCPPHARIAALEDLLCPAEMEVPA